MVGRWPTRRRESMRSGVTGLIGVALLAAGCGSSPRSIQDAHPTGAAAAPPEAGAACACKSPGSGPARLGAVRQGGAVALVQAGTSTLAYVADEDDGLLHTIDVDTGTERAVTPLPGSPSQLI